MKKTLIAGLMGLLLVPSLSFAQVDSPQDTDSIVAGLNDQIEQLTIQILLLQIADLQAQIAALIAAQGAVGSAPVDVVADPVVESAAAECEFLKGEEETKKQEISTLQFQQTNETNALNKQYSGSILRGSREGAVKYNEYEAQLKPMRAELVQLTEEIKVGCQ